MMIPRFLVAAFCVLGPLTCAPQGRINGEATYISFSVPGALGTYPMSINASMTVTGYYYISPTTTSGFVREADGAITTFSVRDGVWTEPESINANGDITGFFEVVAGSPQGFLRYADGRIITINPPCLPQYPYLCNMSQPVSINDYGEIAGSYPYLGAGAAAGFSRSRAGVFTMIRSDLGADYGTVATAINASGSVVGYWSESGNQVGFLSHPDGFWEPFDVPLKLGQDDYVTSEVTTPESINADGAIAGWYNAFIQTCLLGCDNPTTAAGGFVLSPDGVTTLFNPPGTLVTFPVIDSFFGEIPLFSFPRSISINQEGSITGSYVDTAGVQHGFVRNPYGTLATFDPPEGNQTTATSINDGGAIAGFYHYHAGGGPPVGFIRVP